MRRGTLALLATCTLLAPASARAFERTTTCISVCNDVCEFANDGVCQDGGDGAIIEDVASCIYGSDCGDCGYRPVPGSSIYHCRSTCNDSCDSAQDGVCQDGGRGSIPEGGPSCARGSDCTDCGYRFDEQPRPIAWTVPCVAWYANEAGVDEIPDFDAVRDAIQASFDTWNEVDCSFLTAAYGGTTDESRPGFSTCDDNVNFVGFVESGWNERRYPSLALALTSVTFDLRNGTIVDADIELNSANFTYAIVEGDVGAAAVQDVQNVVTHEVGHFLGLDHTRPETHVGPGIYTSATMTDRSPGGDTTKRSLHEDDVAGLCTIYPLDSPTADDRCDLPEVGFLPAPETGPDESCPDGAGDTVVTRRRCSSAPHGGPTFLGFLALVALTRRR